VPIVTANQFGVNWRIFSSRLSWLPLRERRAVRVWLIAISVKGFGE
jgi:hypothetical protein